MCYMCYRWYIGVVNEQKRAMEDISDPRVVPRTAHYSYCSHLDQVDDPAGGPNRHLTPDLEALDLEVWT